MAMVASIEKMRLQLGISPVVLLADGLDHVRIIEDWYLFHEYLEEFNEPEYFHEFIARAQRYDLQYLGEADCEMMSAANFPPAAEVAQAEASFFPGVDREVLAATIASYQKLGNWSPHVEITRPAWEATLDIFLHSGLITRRHRYEDVIATPPSG